MYHNNHDGDVHGNRHPRWLRAQCKRRHPRREMGIAVGDYDGDGWLDILKPNFAAKTSAFTTTIGIGILYDAVYRSGLAWRRQMSVGARGSRTSTMTET